MFRSYQSILQSPLVPLGALGPLVQVGPPVRECSLRLHVVKTRHDEEENVKRLGKKTRGNLIVVIVSMLHCATWSWLRSCGSRFWTSTVKNIQDHKRMGHHVIFQYLLAQIPTTTTSQLPLALLALPPENVHMAEKRPRHFVQLCLQFLSSQWNANITHQQDAPSAYMASGSEINFLVRVPSSFFFLHDRGLQKKQTVMPKQMLQQTRTSHVG